MPKDDELITYCDANRLHSYNCDDPALIRVDHLPNGGDLPDHDPPLHHFASDHLGNRLAQNRNEIREIHAHSDDVDQSFRSDADQI
ncbi:MAG: hypothetical protein AAB225_19185, partial [Acidobacteriota bacterium]